MSTQIFSSPFGLQCKGFWSGHLCKPVQILYATFSWVSQSGFQGFLILENGVSGFGDWSAVFPLLGWGFRISGLEVPKLPRYWTCVCGCRKQRALPQMAACLGSPIVQHMVIQAGGLFFPLRTWAVKRVYDSFFIFKPIFLQSSSTTHLACSDNEALNWTSGPFQLKPWTSKDNSCQTEMSRSLVCSLGAQCAAASRRCCVQTPSFEALPTSRKACVVLTAPFRFISKNAKWAALSKTPLAVSSPLAWRISTFAIWACSSWISFWDFSLSSANANFFSDSANFNFSLSSANFFSDSSLSSANANFFSDSSLSSKNPAIAAFRLSVSLIWFRISMRFVVFFRAEVVTCVDTTRRSVLHKMRWQRAQNSARKWLLIDRGLAKGLQQFPWKWRREDHHLAWTFQKDAFKR